MEEAPKMNWFKSFILGPYWIAPLILLVGLSAFSLGRTYNIEKSREPVKVIDNRQQTVETSKNQVQKSSNSQNSASAIQSQPKAQTDSSSGQVVGSKNSTKYHYPWCSGAKRISPENLITFASIAEARSKGYTPASNCAGLK